ncbi:MAG: MobA/MobL family protein [Rhodocyclales bacterium]|nr:MobA/MobL family protein [Rhodocyclales bacterium]
MRLGRFAERHDGELAHAESGNMPGWAAADPRKFWVESDARERANGTLYHEVEFALPRELSRKQQIEAAREQVRQICGDQHPYSWGLHDKEGNPHVHLEFSGRMLDGIERDTDQFFKRYNAKNPERGGCRKESSGDARGPDWVKQVRQDWQDIANRHLAAAGHDARIDHRSNKARGLDEAPGVHLGRRATRLEQRGKSTWRGLKNREAAHLNASLQEVRSKIHQKEISNGKERHGRPGKPHAQQQHRAGVGGTAAAPKRAFAAWNDRGADRSGLRASGHLGPQRMPALRHSRSGHGQQEPRDAVLQRSVPGHRDGNHRMHGVPAGGLYTVEALDRRQIYKAKLLQESYQQEIQSALAARLAYVDRQPDRIAITLKGGGGRVTDYGDRLLTKSGRDQELLAAVALATAKGWKTIHLTGSADFKARAWLEASRAGFQVTGYEPSPDLRAQFEKEKTMLGAPGGTSLTPDAAPDSQADASARRWADALRQAKDRLEAARQSACALSLYEVDLQRKKVAAWLEEVGRRGINDDLLWQIGHHQVGDGKKAPESVKAALAPLYQLRQDEIEGRKHAAELARQEQIQRELMAQSKADGLADLMTQPGKSAAQMEAMQQEHRYYTALAAGYDEAEARERSANPNTAPRPV